MSEVLDAGDMCGYHLGRVISFNWEMPGEGRTQAVITGELRQVSHSSGETVLMLCSPILDAGGAMDEFVLQIGVPVTVKDS